MAAKTGDRRVARTRAMLQGALNAMMIEKGYAATTVQDIIDRANVGRSTFYAHFADKQTLLASGLEDLRGYLLEHSRHGGAPGQAPPLGFSRAMLDHARGHLELYRAIVGQESGAYVMQRFHLIIADLVRRELSAAGYPAERRELAVQFVAGAFMGVLRWWLDQGAELPPAEVDTIFRGLVTRGLG
jgi:AcrR family transcriptional regulator